MSNMIKLIFIIISVTFLILIYREWRRVAKRGDAQEALDQALSQSEELDILLMTKRIKEGNARKKEQLN